MKRSFRKFLALCLTMLLATSGFGYTEPIDMEASDLSGLEIDMPLQGDDGPSGQGETPEEETGGLQLGDGVEGLLDPPQPLDGASLQLDVPAEVTLNAEVEGVTFAVTGILAPDTVLSVSRPEDETLAEAAARSTENLLERQVAHNIYCIELLDAAGERIVLDPLALPTVTVNGLSIDGVTAYDSVLDGSYEIELDQKALCFKFAGQGIYDLYGHMMAQPEDQPADGPPEQPADDTSTPADGDTAEDIKADDQKPSPDGEGGAAQSAVTDEVASPGDTSTPTDSDTADESSPDDQKPSPSGEGAPTGADEVGPSDDTSTSDNKEETTSSVSPDGEPASLQGEAMGIDDTSTLTDSDTTDESSPDDQKPSLSGEGAPAGADEVASPDDTSTLTDGDTADESSTSDQQEQPTSDQQDQPTDELPDAPSDTPTDEFPDDTSTSPDPAPVPFDQSVTLNGVTVTVQAEPGVFPANAVLSVKRVPSYKRRQADAAIEEIRDEDQNVAVSYTFDIKVIDPDTKEELQPAEGRTVNVSFAMAEVADENLTTNVYHIEDGEAQKLDVTTEVTPETGEETTAAVETSGFSLYTVEFTYNNP